jgi:hypothetical protein
MSKNAYAYRLMLDNDTFRLSRAAGRENYICCRIKIGISRIGVVLFAQACHVRPVQHESMIAQLVDEMLVSFRYDDDGRFNLLKDESGAIRSLRNIERDKGAARFHDTQHGYSHPHGLFKAQWNQNFLSHTRADKSIRKLGRQAV